jgi:hypothetical protein
MHLQLFQTPPLLTVVIKLSTVCSTKAIDGGPALPLLI